MSDKTYTADQVAKKVLSKYHDLAKGLFSDKLQSCSPEKAQDTKDSVFREITWALDEIKRLRELSWTVESEVPTAKDMFEKEFEKAKDKLATLARRHKALKKSEEGNEIEELVAKTLTVADEIWKSENDVNWNSRGVHQGVPTKATAGTDKAYANSQAGHAVKAGAKKVAIKEHKKVLSEIKDQPKPNLPKSEDGVEKCGEMSVKKEENNKLKEFLNKKKAKKTGKMEKMLGMNSSAAPGANTAETPKPSIATQIGWPGSNK